MRGILAELEAAGLVTLADKGYQGSTYAKIPYKGKNKPVPETGQQGAREAPRTRRKGERPAQDLEDPHQTPLLPLARRSARQGHPRTAAPRSITRMEKAQYQQALDHAAEQADGHPTSQPD